MAILLAGSPGRIDMKITYNKVFYKIKWYNCYDIGERKADIHGTEYKCKERYVTWNMIKEETKGQRNVIQ